jgi:ubiquitin carboxyl-terminal hydrolase L5
MDMLNADLTLSNEVKAAKNQGKRKTSKKKEAENEPGFHFSAFVPIKGNVYKLDGLDRQPMILGLSWRFPSLNAMH